MSILKRKSRNTTSESHWGESQAAKLHEYTKYSELELLKKTPRIVEYMTDSRYMLETARNFKEYLEEKSLALAEPESPQLNFYDLLKTRRSKHKFSGKAVSFQQFSNILGWSVGATQSLKVNKHGLKNEIMSKRTYPSGGGLYPCETYIVALNVEQLGQGIYHYNNLKHSLDPIQKDIDKVLLKRILIANDFIDDIAFIVVVTSMFERQITKYRDRAYRFSLIESGHLMQNLLLSATAEDLSSLPWGGYMDNEVAALLGTDVISEPPVHMAFVGKGPE